MKRFFILLMFLSSSLLFAQDIFSALYLDLDELDQILERQQNYINNQQMTLNDLQNKIELSENDVKTLRDISLLQGELLNSYEQKMRWQEQIQQEQLRYQKKLGRELLIWKAGGVTFAASTLGLLIWGLNR